jgi:hypothetical protein
MLHVQVEATGDKKAAASSNGNETIFAPPNPWSDGPIVESWNKIQDKFDTTSNALHNPQYLQMRMGSSSFPHGQAVDQTCFTIVCSKSSFKYQGLRQVTPRSFIGRQRNDLTVTALIPTKQPSEATGRVNPGHAAPINGTGARNQSRGVTVGNECIIAYRRIF